MIEENYVSLDTAKMLKEAGFNEPCRIHYTKNGGRWEGVIPTVMDDIGNHTWFPCPTQSLAARWLREGHNIMIIPFFDDYMGKWYYVVDGVKKQSGIKCVQSASDYDDYETAFENGLQEAIKLIKK